MAGLGERLKAQRARKRDADRKARNLTDKISARLALLAERPRLAAYLTRRFDLRFTSGWRSRAHNAAVGGVPGSWHTRGTLTHPKALDFVGTEQEMQAALVWAREHLNLAEGLIHDVGSGRHLHLAGDAVGAWRHPEGGRLKRWRKARRRQRERGADAARGIRRLLIARKARLAGARHVLPIIRAAQEIGVPLPWAFALVEQESAFKNIFGCDHGRLADNSSAPFCRVPVTKDRVAQLRKWVSDGHASNGVGLTQLTDIGLIRAADARGGAHKITPQLQVGFTHFKARAGANYALNSWRYNGRRSYQQEIDAKHAKWERVLS